jgi:hypothetical protein
MHKISSGNTFFYKKVFPVIWFGTAAILVAVVFILQRVGANLPIPVLVAPIIVGVISFVAMKKFSVDLVDEVWDAGDTLVVKWKNEEDHIPLAGIINISYSAFTNPKRATLTLRHPGRFGKEITFCPITKASFSPKNPIIDDLIERVDRARQGH